MKKVYDNQFEVYLSDSLVEARTMTNENTKKFLTYFEKVQQKSTLLVKGKNDIDAICNNLVLFNIRESCSLHRSNIYDIEIFNSFSRKFFGSAKMYDTFIGFTKTKEYGEIEGSVKKIIKDTELRAHNPVFDAYITLVIAVVINLILIREMM
jgi:hypothetical protein